MSNSILINSFKSLKRHLDKEDKTKAIINFIFIFFISLLDVFGLASIIPVVLAAAESNYIHTNKYLSSIYQFFHFSSDRDFLAFLIISILILFFVKNTFSLYVYKRQVGFTASVGLKLNDKQFSKYYDLPFIQFNQLGSAKIISHINSAPAQFLSGIFQPLIIFISESIMVTIIILGIAIYQPALFAILAIILGPATMLIYRALKNKSASIGYELEQLNIVSYNILADSFSGYVEVKLANKQTFFQNQYLKNQKRTQKLKAKFYLFSLIPPKALELIAVLGIVIIFLYSLYWSNSPKQLITFIGLFAAAAYRIMPSISKILSALMNMKNSQYAIDRLNLYEEESVNNVDTVQKQISELPFKQQIIFNCISYSFPKSNKPTLDDITLHINKGEKIGFIGTSGSGKTTLMNVLLRFYIEQRGEILVDGERLCDKNITAWRKLIGYVKQDVFLMNASFIDNITLGEPEPDIERLNSAIELASLGELVNSLPRGMETKLGEKGSRLSGGQKQRIGIARALYKNAEILVLDEATSALDNETEREVTEAIYNLSHTNITMFIIAHRITTLKDCDRIYELKEGKIIKEHNYKELVRSFV